MGQHVAPTWTIRSAAQCSMHAMVAELPESVVVVEGLDQGPFTIQNGLAAHLQRRCQLAPFNGQRPVHHGKLADLRHARKVLVDLIDGALHRCQHKGMPLQRAHLGRWQPMPHGELGQGGLIQGQYGCQVVAPITANDGVVTQVVMPDVASTSKSRLGFSTTGFSRLKSVPAVASEQYKSITDRSNEKGA